MNILYAVVVQSPLATVAEHLRQRVKEKRVSSVIHVTDSGYLLGQLLQHLERFQKRNLVVVLEQSY
jgi:hypothetical protein